MLHYAVVFFVIAIIAAVLGFSGIAGAASNVAWILFIVLLILAVLSLFRKKVCWRGVNENSPPRWFGAGRCLAAVAMLSWRWNYTAPCPPHDAPTPIPPVA